MKLHWKHGPKKTVQLRPVVAVEESTDCGCRSNLTVLSALTWIYITVLEDIEELSIQLELGSIEDMKKSNLKG